MPIAFLRNERAAYYGRYHANPRPEQLARFFYLSPQNMRFLAGYRRSYTRLGCAVQLGTWRFLSTLLSEPTQALAQRLHRHRLLQPTVLMWLTGTNELVWY